MAGNYRTVTGYPYDGFDDGDESFEMLLDGAAEGPDSGYGPEPAARETP